MRRGWLVCAALALSACGDDGVGGADGEGGEGEGGGASGGSGSTPTSCTEAWDDVDADVSACSAEAEAVVASLMNLAGITIDNNGEEMTPCLEVKCDDSFAYVLSNALPHYDFVQTTPNALVENLGVFKIPLSPAPVEESPGATDASSIDGCVQAYDQWFAGNATQDEPSGYCGDAAIYDTLAAGGRLDAHQIACLGTIGVTISGVPIYGPNEGAVPEPYGTPMFVMPDTADVPASDAGGMSVALDLCGGHTAASMHYHAVNDACFERDESGAPARSYVDAAGSWDVADLFDGDCTEESGIVGWSFDGYPVKGPCVCVARDEGGACTSVKRARSTWVYGGLGRWGDDPSEATELGIDGSACDTDEDCGCTESTCDFYCKYVTRDDAGAPGGSSVEKACVLHAYAWCVHEYVDRSATDTSAESFVYMDRCNGFDGPDGYAYHATAGFPHLIGCQHGAPTGSEARIGAGGGPGGHP